MTRNAFSLIELSIVLVILGLLVGGILGGQSLIHAAELRSVLTDRDRFVTAINTFRSKYNALPGDMKNATDYWTAQDGGDGFGTDCTAAASTTQATCNGDGNGKIANMQDYTSANTYESFRAWQHLANAGLVEGGLSGNIISGNTAYPGRNIPKSKINGAGWHIQSDASSGYLGGFFYPGTDGHFLVLGASQGGGYYNYAPVLPAEDAYSIDSKIDDGKPITGAMLIMGDFGSPETCSTGTAPNKTYNLGSSTIACYPFMKLGF